MSGHSQYPSHQHNVNSHDRIFGSVDAGATPALQSAADVSGESSPGGVAEPSARRRRWVRARTRTQHLSSLSLEDAESSSSVVGAPGDPGDSSLLPASADPVAVESPPSVGGRYPFRRPDGNPVTGEGYARVGGSDLQASVSMRKPPCH